VEKVVYAPEANDDLESIVDFIARDKPRAARDWLQRIRETCEMLATQPEAGEEYREFGIRGCRSFCVGQYVVFYRAFAEGIEVSRVLHGSRDIRNC
jgi:toxin ParE1/3/4